MASTTKTREPQVIIIPKQADAGGADRKRKPPLLTILFSILALIALSHFIAVMHNINPGVAPVNCPGLMRSTDYTHMVHLQPRTQEMEAVQYVNPLVGGQPAALVEVMNTNAQHTLDVYVYGCSMQKQSPNITTLFVQRGLVQGTVEVSPANTLVTGQLDATLSLQAVATMQPLQQNVYREYAWHNGAFVQTSYPSLYPVTSRSEAEQLQQQAKSGQSLLWSDPLSTAEQMAKDMLKWTPNGAQDTVLDNNGTSAHVRIVQQNPHLEVTVSLSRLVQHDSKGLWFVVGAQTNSITLTQPQVTSPISSPLTTRGTGALPGGQTIATLFDHTLTPLTLLQNGALNTHANGTFNGTLFYKNSIPGQPGLLLLQSLPPAGSSEEGQVLLTSVILG